MLREWRQRRASRRRAGRATFARLRREAWRAALRSWRVVLGVTGGWLLLTVVVVLIQRTDLLRGFFAGLMLGVYAVFVMTFLISTGIAQRQMGGSAEQWTAEVFERLDRKLWYVAHDVSFDRLNVDHVLVGPGRIYAVETKWTTWGGDPRFTSTARACAERGARKLRSLLLSRGFKREIVPLLVLWGPGTDRLQAEPTWTDGVGVVAGVHANAWLPRLQVATHGVARDLPVERAVTGFVAARDAYAEAT
jgi:hypothetical protein